jgi:hypothetical protein
VIIFLALVMGVPQIGTQLKVSSLDLAHIAVITGICLVAVCWQEIAKIMTYNTRSG